MDNQFSHMQKLAFGKSLTNSKPLNESVLKEKIKELVHSSLGEAKKKKKEKQEDVAPQEDVDVDLNVGGESNPEPEPSMDTVTPTDGGMDIDPTIKSIQDSLQKAYASAKQLGDEKLMNQIGNTITMLVRTQVLGGQAAE